MSKTNNNNKQTPLALQLASTSHLAYRVGWQRQASAELRRLHDVNADLALDLLAACNYIDALGGDSTKYRQTYAKATGVQS